MGHLMMRTALKVTITMMEYLLYNSYTTVMRYLREGRRVLAHRHDPQQPGDAEELDRGDGIAGQGQVDVPRHDGGQVDERDCPRRKPPFWAVKRPAHPHESATQN